MSRALSNRLAKLEKAMNATPLSRYTDEELHEEFRANCRHLADTYGSVEAAIIAIEPDPARAVAIIALSAQAQAIVFGHPA